MLKRCTKCGEDKDEAKDFHRYANSDKPRARCKDCINKANVAHQAANPVKATARTNVWRAKNPGRASAISRAWQLRHPEQFRAQVYRSRFKIDFDAMWEAQDGKCAACNQPMLRRGKDPTSVCADHDSSCCPGKKSCGKCVRGLIHRNCNLILGYARDDIEVLQKVAAYLDRWRLRFSPHAPSSVNLAHQGS